MRTTPRTPVRTAPSGHGDLVAHVATGPALPPLTDAAVARIRGRAAAVRAPRELRPLSLADFDAFVQRHRLVHFPQSREHAAWRERTGSAYVLGFGRGRRLEAAGLFTLRRLPGGLVECYAQRGPVLDWADLDLVATFLAALERFLLRRGVVSLRLDPYLAEAETPLGRTALRAAGSPAWRPADPTGRVAALTALLRAHGYRHEPPVPGYSALSQVGFHAVLPLAGRDAAGLAAAMDQQRRRHLRRAARADLHLAPVPPARLGEFTALLAATARRKGFRSRDHDYFAELLRWYGPRAGLLGASPGDGGPLVAGALWVQGPGELVYLAGASSQEGRRRAAPYALQAALVAAARARGMTRYNLYGVSGDFSADAPDAGSTAFKLGLGCQIVRYVGDFVKAVPLVETARGTLRGLRRARRIGGATEDGDDAQV